jgi:hypothetical protein
LDSPVVAERETEREGHRAAGEIARDLRVGNVLAADGSHGVDGITDRRHLGPPRADRGDAMMLVPLVLGDRVVGELREVGVGINSWRKAEVAVDEFSRIVDVKLLAIEGDWDSYRGYGAAVDDELRAGDR